MTKKCDNINKYMAKKFNIGDLVIHFREGLAEIVSSTEMGGKEYFLVSAKRGSGERIYVPIEKANSIIRHVLTKGDADKLLAYMKGIEEEFNSNTKQRRDAFKRRLASGDVYDIAFLSRQLYYFNVQDENNPTIKYGPVDLDMLRYADNVLMDELSLSYDIPREDILDFIVNKINNM